MLKKIVLMGCALALGVVPLMAQEAPPEPEPPQVVLMPPPDTEKPEDAGEPPADPEAVEAWITAIFHSMMDTDGNGELSAGEFRAWVAHVHMSPPPPPPPPPPPLPEGEFEPAFPVTFWDFDDFVAALDEDVIIINFDALPTGPAVPPGFNLDKSLAGGPLTGTEWQSLGAIFYSPIGAALRTVSTVEHYPPPHMNDPMIDLYVSRPNSLTMGAAPYTPPLDPADNNNVIDENDDSLVIELIPPRGGVGFYLVDQDAGDPPPAGEGIVFKDASDLVIETIQPLPSAIYPNHQFIGITSLGRPIAKIEINEAALGFGDDIAIDHVVLSQ